MTAKELREKYIAFFIEQGHAEISGKSLIPENDPTVLFTTAGMHPLVPYILGAEHPAGRRLVNVQKCLRTGDIDAVGDSSHLTFFEMLGNWSLGDYFKEESIQMSYEFLTGSRWLGIPRERLAVTVFEGDADAPRDSESAELWKRMGISEERIYYLPKKDNWWGPPGATGPCGPDTEIFYDTGIAGSPASRPGVGDGKWLEIWNNVFMQYSKAGDGSFSPLERRCVDTGMGVERTCTILQGRKSVYETELFMPIIAGLESLGAPSYTGNTRNTAGTGEAAGAEAASDRSIRIICDHIRSACFMLSDGLVPSNLGRGYILRRLIRRLIRHGNELALPLGFARNLGEVLIENYAELHPELEAQAGVITAELQQESERFSQTLVRGEQEFEKIVQGLSAGAKTIPGRAAFRLYDTYGFPLELSEELAAERGLSVDRSAFNAAFAEHQQTSKNDASSSFKGGLADHSEATTALHTATHLLHEALCRVLGSHIAQKGSNITPERLRFDFSHPSKMTAEELAEVEGMVNEQISRRLSITQEQMPLEQARARGAKALFGEKYDSVVRVYAIGDFSLEVCGGPHASDTGSLGRFKILKEQSSSQGVRRIKAVLL